MPNNPHIVISVLRGSRQGDAKRHSAAQRLLQAFATVHECYYVARTATISHHQPAPHSLVQFSMPLTV